MKSLEITIYWSSFKFFQNLNDLPQLAGLEEDLAFKHEIETQVGFYKAARYWICKLKLFTDHFKAYKLASVHAPVWGYFYKAEFYTN